VINTTGWVKAEGYRCLTHIAQAFEVPTHSFNNPLLILQSTLYHFPHFGNMDNLGGRGLSLGPGETVQWVMSWHAVLRQGCLPGKEWRGKFPILVFRIKTIKNVVKYWFRLLNEARRIGLSRETLESVNTFTGNPGFRLSTHTPSKSNCQRFVLSLSSRTDMTELKLFRCTMSYAIHASFTNLHSLFKL
jgi:hypothetical protein